MSIATVYRRVNETIDLLAARPSSLPKALRRARRGGGDVVIVDGTLINPIVWLSQKTSNRAHAQLRDKGERAFAEPKKRRVLHQLRCDPARAPTSPRAIHTLNQTG